MRHPGVGTIFDLLFIPVPSRSSSLLRIKKDGSPLKEVCLTIKSFLIEKKSISDRSTPAKRLFLQLEASETNAGEHDICTWTIFIERENCTRSFHRFLPRFACHVRREIPKSKRKYFAELPRTFSVRGQGPRPGRPFVLPYKNRWKCATRSISIEEVRRCGILIRIN